MGGGERSEEVKVKREEEEYPFLKEGVELRFGLNHPFYPFLNFPFLAGH